MFRKLYWICLSPDQYPTLCHNYDAKWVCNPWSVYSVTICDILVLFVVLVKYISDSYLESSFESIVLLFARQSPIEHRIDRFVIM